jgi:hypothetical protein
VTTFAGHTYANGQVPAGVLAPLDDQPYAALRTDAAQAWNRARRDVINQAGVMLTVRGWNRTLAEQQRFFLERYRPQATGTGTYGDVRWWRGVRYVRFGTAAAAIPGTSNHGWGLAVDVVDYGTVGQFDYSRRARTFPILARHGWTDDEGRDPDTLEPWHLVYDPNRDTHPEVDTMTPDEFRAIVREVVRAEVGNLVWGHKLTHRDVVDQPAVVIAVDTRILAGQAADGPSITVDVDDAGVTAIAGAVVDELHTRTGRQA